MVDDPPRGTAALDRALVSGLAWTASFKWTGQLVSWAATLYAARQLTPRDYGLVSMAMIGVGLARMVQDFGLDGILVQDRSIVGKRLAELGGLLVGLGMLLWALFAAAAPFFATFFHEPQVTMIILVGGGVFVTDALQVIPRAQMQRAVRFDQLAWTNFAQLAFTQVALIIAVRSGLGFWSMIAATLVGEVAVTLILLRISPYAVAWPRHLRELTRPLLNGWRMMGSRAAWYAYSNADQTIIGRLLGSSALGIYSFATIFSSVPQNQIGTIVSQVVPAIFSQVQERPEELRRYFLRMTEALTVFSFPMSVGLALVADLVLPLVGPQWNEVVVPLRLLCAYSVFQASQAMVSHVLLWTGQFRVHMWCAILAGVVMPPALYVAARSFGLLGIGWTWVLIFPLANLPSFFFAFRTARMTALDWLDSLRPASVGCVAMAVAVLALRRFLPPDLDLRLTAIVCVAGGAAAYTITLWLAFRSRVAAGIALIRAMRGGQPVTA